MASYMVYWPQDQVEKLKKAGDTGPIKVVFGSLHSRMPTIASIKVGDIVYPVTLLKKQLYALARLPVTHREPAFDYCMRELGRDYGALFPKGVVVEHPEAFYWSWEGKSYDSPAALPPGARLISQAEQGDKPHLAHQEPFNCCSQWAVWGEEGSSIELRPLAAGDIPLLRFGYPKSKEKALRLDKNGNVLSMSLTATRRMSEETAQIFDALF